AARAAMDEDAHAFLHLGELDERNPCGKSGDAKTSRLRGIYPYGYRRDRALQERRVLGVRAIAARVSDASDELAIELSRAVAAEGAGKREREDIFQQTAAHLPVDRIHARGAHLDQHLPGIRLWRRHLVEAHYRRAAVAMDPYRTHQRTSFSPASLRMSRMRAVNSS